MFFLEGAPAILFGVLTYFVLIDRPEQAKFLNPEEKDWLIAELKQEQLAISQKKQISKWEALKNRRVWHFSFIYFFLVVGLYGISFWMPTIIKGVSKVLSNTQVGLLAALPAICGVISMILFARHSDKTMERRWHVAIPTFVAGMHVRSANDYK